MPVSRSGVPDARWDETLRRAGGHFLQTSGWAKVQDALGYDSVYAESDNEWMWSGHIGSAAGIRYLYVPCGPTTIQATATEECVESLLEAARERRISFVRLEPMGATNLFVLLNGGREVKPVQPKYTWVLDIAQEESVLRRGLSKGHKGSINGAERRGLSFRKSEDPAEASILIDLMRKTSTRGGFHVAGKRYYTEMLKQLMPTGAASLYFAEAEEKAVAAAVCFDFNGTRHYAYAGSDPESARRLSAAAPLVWRMILDAKQQGAKTFDFWGVLPRPKPKHPWSGFTQFKQAFGGRPEERAGTWEITVRKWRHRAYRTAKLVRL